MTVARRIPAAAALALVLGLQPANGFVVDVNTNGVVRQWALAQPDLRVPVTSVDRAARAIIFHLDAAGYSRTNTAAELESVRAAFDQWAAVPGGQVRFREGPLVSGTVDVNLADGVNRVFWATNLTVNGGRDDLRGVLALTYVAAFNMGDPVIREADMVFNGAEFRWFTDPAGGDGQAVFIEAIALHEAGHFLGLRHSPVGGATMLFDGERGVNSYLELSSDEVAAVRAIYGSGQVAAGSLKGLLRSGGAAVLGGAVFAEDADGNTAAGTVSRATGEYELAGLTPGAYVVRVAPLDPLTAANYLIRGADIAPAYRSAMTEFLPTVGVSRTVAAGSSQVVDIDLSSGSPLRVARLLRPSSSLANPDFIAKPVRLTRGTNGVFVGALISGAALGSELGITGTGVRVGPVEVRENVRGALSLVAARVSVDAEAAPGLRSLWVRRGGLTGWANGFVEIAPEVPDGNFDGLDDTFQRQYWPRFTLPEAGPAADPDDDGFTNAWEYATGSIPTNRLSAHFRVLSVQVQLDGARVRSETAAGKTFRLLARDAIPGSAWTVVSEAKPATGGETEFRDPAAQGRVRFYRVELVP